ncbi:MAG: DUF4397 domain-containing protein [Bacillus sp. (in: Bacteria)]|nr:DUF4397 domain-containing protein [Bacillus sp. (in: firmicutes)]
MKKKTILFMLSFTLITLFHSQGVAAVSDGAAVRIIHASPDAPNLDIYFKKENLFSEIPFKHLSEYVSLPEGSYKIQVYPEGANPKKEKPIIKEKVDIHAGEPTTLAVIGQDNEFSLIAYLDKVNEEKESEIRLVHLAPDISQITLEGKSVLVENLSYSKASEYVQVEPTKQDIKITNSGQGGTLYEIPNLQLMEGLNYSIFTLGLLNGEPGFDVVITKDQLK